jgi:hypothetical protein
MSDKPWLSRRVVLAVFGALIVGAIGAFVAAHAAAGTGTTATNHPVTQGKTPTATSSAISSPTATATASPSQPTDLEGIILTVSTSDNVFSMVLADQSILNVSVTDATHYSGDASSLADLQEGMSAQVTGQYLADQTFQASAVYATFGS